MIVVISALASFVTGSAIFFIVGCVCGRCSEKQMCKSSTKSSSSENDQDETSQDNTLYEDILCKQEDEQQLELKQNVAYGPLR